MERDEDITLIGMQMHMERCQQSQANKCSGWNLVFVAKPTTMLVIEGGETIKKPGGEQCEFQLLEGNILYSEALGPIA